MTYEELVDLLWRWKYGALPLVTINDVRQAVVQYGQAEANQRAMEMQAALDRVEAVCCELDVSFRGSNIMGRIRHAASTAESGPTDG